MKPTALTLSVFDIFRDLTVEERGGVANTMKISEYASGGYVLPTLNDQNSVYFLVSGQVRACAYSHSGKQVYFEELFPGTMFGELSAIDSEERSSDCICTETSLVLHLGQQQFLDLMEQYPSVKSRVLIRLVGMVRRQLKRVYEYTSYSVNQRIRFELLRLVSETGHDVPPIVLKAVPTQAELADRISSHREAVSRELKILESEGLITWSRHAHVIQDPAGLLKRANAQ